MVDAATPALEKALREMDVLAPLENGEFVVDAARQYAGRGGPGREANEDHDEQLHRCRWSIANCTCGSATASPS